jgi:hypothetical protein
MCSTANRDHPAILLEEHASRLLGLRLRSVRYYNIPFGLTDTPNWDHGSAHIADFGVDLITDQGTVGVTWTNDITVYGLGIVAGPLIERLSSSVQVTNVADQEPWTSLEGHEIASVKLHWVEWHFPQQRPTSPFALELGFADSGGVLLVSGKWNGPNKPIFTGGDDITVLWRNDSLRVLVPQIADDVGALG